MIIFCHSCLQPLRAKSAADFDGRRFASNGGVMLQAASSHRRGIGGDPTRITHMDNDFFVTNLDRNSPE
jgi:hypothetical protein